MEYETLNTVCSNAVWSLSNFIGGLVVCLAYERGKVRNLYDNMDAFYREHVYNLPAETTSTKDSKLEKTTS